jgi:hypothetical protein
MEPTYGSDYDSFRTPLGLGNIVDSFGISIGGYSRMFVSITITNASYYGVSAETTVSPYMIYWGERGYENVPSDSVSAVYYGTNLPAYSLQIPPEFKTRNYYCTLYFRVNSTALSGWVDWEARIYLRNE